MSRLQDLPELPDEILLPEVLYSDGKTYAEDDTYAVRWKVPTEDGITREYGRRKSDNKIVMINVQDVATLLKKMEDRNTGIV